MLGFSDSTFSSSLHPPGSPPKVPSSLDTHQKRNPIQLTPLWEYVVRNQSIPPDINLDDVFTAINERLRNPEWEVRQHALRVLVDVIPVMDESLDRRMEVLLGDLVGNLGHPGPAVRKGALDSLKVYLNHSSHSDEILRNIVYRGVEHFTDNQLQSDVVVGIILSLPSLTTLGKTSESTNEYIVKVLIGKLVQITFQEVSLRSLARIRDIITPKEFDRILEDTQPNTRRDFELLCQVYDTHSQKLSYKDKNSSDEDRTTKWNDLNANIIHDNRWNSDSDSAGILSQDDTKPKDSENNVPAGKVILETEIQFNSSTAVTMKILEEGEKNNENDSDSDQDDNDCVVKVLSDSDDGFELRRRTPRRVRFGGEIVKLRTPDSDSNHPSDTDDITITTSNENTNNPVIEIKFITNEKRSHQSRSLIPVPVAPTTQKPKARSLPTSPNRSKLENGNKTKLLYQSHPNLTRAHFFNKQKSQKLNPPAKKLNVKVPKKGNYIDNATSPIPLHREVELLHNLIRSPTHVKSIPDVKKPISRRPSFKREGSRKEISKLETMKKEPTRREIFTKSEDLLKLEAPKTDVTKNETSKKDDISFIDRKITTADSILLPSKPIKDNRPIVTADPNKSRPNVLKKELSLNSNAETFTTDFSDNESNKSRTFSSFILKDSGSDGIQSDCYIPNLDNGECLTCSSSGSDGVQMENSWETVGLIEKRIIEDMHNKDDWRVKLRGFESFQECLKSSELQNALSPHLSTVFYFLFNAERQPKLQIIVETILQTLISTSSPENLKPCLSQLAVNFSKMGSPVGIRLAIALMQKISAKSFIQYVLEDSIMSSRSAKTREGALQIILSATTMFPSTEFDSNIIANKVALVATDRKRRIRQAALDVLAVLGQIGRPGEILETVGKASQDLPDKDGLVAAVRARLSRRQLPIVEADGSVIYASPGVGHGVDVDWVAAGSGSISPCSARSRRRAMDTTRMETTTETTKTESAGLSQRNRWSARRFEESSESFRGPQDMTWALVPVNNKEESQNKSYSGTQLWALEQSPTNGEIQLNGSSGSLRPVYLLQAQQPQQQQTRPRQTPQNNNDSSSGRGSAEKTNHRVYSRGRSSSPPVRLVQIKGATRSTRGQSSSPPDYRGRNIVQQDVRRRVFPASVSVSSGSSSRSRESLPRNNWHREFQSAIPVPVSGEGRSRFRRRHRESLPSSQQQPMPVYGHHGIGSAPVNNYGRTKSPSPTRFSVDKFSLSQDSGINQQTSSSSSSESSDYYTPPAEPYLPIQPTEPPQSQPHNYDQSDESDPSIHQQPRGRFINLEDTPSSDFDEVDGKKNSDESQDDHDFVRSQKFQKLQQEHITRNIIQDSSYREKVESRLSKSHHDLSEVKNLNRKSINSAPPVKHFRAFESNKLIENKLNNNNIVDEEIKTSQSTLELKSLNQSQASLNRSQTSLNQNLTYSQLELRDISQTQSDLQNLNPFQSQGSLNNINQNQGDYRTFKNSQGSLNQSQRDLQNHPDLTEIIPEGVKCPEIRKSLKSGPKQKPELKRRSSNIPMKVPTIYPDTLRSFPKPREGLNEMISQLESPEWEMSMKGLQSLVRLVRHHQDTVEGQMHTVCVLLGRHIKNLRSQVARAACVAATEMFETHKKALEMELEEVACPLLSRTADTNKFLRADANAALDTMCLNMNTNRVVGVLSSRGASHHNAVVRCATARLITDLVLKLGSQKVFQMPKETRDRILVIGANMLTEGSLETRKHAKNMFAELSSHGQFQRAIHEAVPATTMRHITKIINNLK